jgi:hypothetical protein
VLIDVVRAVLIVFLGVVFAYLYGYIEHGYIPPGEHLVLRFFHHFSTYHIIMLGLFSALPLAVLIYDPSWVGLLIAFGLFAFLPLGEDMAWYHFAGAWPGPQDWTSWGGGYYVKKHWLPKWYLVNSLATLFFYGLAFAIATL